MGSRVAPALSWLKAGSPHALAAFLLALGAAIAVLIPAQLPGWATHLALPICFAGAFLFGRLSASNGAEKIAQLERELASAEEKAKAASEAKSDFIATVSHEIRTPMNGVIGFTELALAGDIDDDLRGNLEMLAESGRAMLALLNDLLDSAKIDAGRMEAKFEPMQIDHRLRAAVRLMNPIAAQKGITLDIDLDSALPKWIEGDPARLRQIILNLVGNALKFTEEGGVTVSARPAEDGLTYSISVSDTGIGIAGEKLGEIFDKFTQADATIDRRFGGTGLGLPICAKLAELLGGSIAVESKLGRGSTFTLTLPLVKTVAPRRRSSDRTMKKSNILAGRPAKILFVEDNGINQQVTTAMLARLGLTASLAVNGTQAIEMVIAARDADEPFNLVLMDQQLPGMDGLATARAIRGEGFDARTLPIIAVTANASAKGAEACLEAGMQAHLAKPFGLEEFSAVLADWLGTSSAPKENRKTRKPNAKLVKNFSKRKELALRTIDESVRNGSLQSRSLEELASQLHQIAGVAAFFGESDLGARCGALDERLRNEPGSVQANDFEEVRALLSA